MKGLRFFGGVALILTVLSVAWVSLAQAHSFRTGSNVSVADQTINESVFLSGRNVDVSSEVFGDVFCAGQTINISGTIHGDVLCAGQTININGHVDGNVRLAGQVVTVGGAIAGNATIGGQTFNLGLSGSIAGDATIGSNDATFNGPVGRDIAVGGDSVILNSTINRNVKGSVNNLKLNSNAVVKGDIEFTSSNNVDRAPGAIVEGKISRTEPIKNDQPKRGAVFGFALGWFIYWFIAMLATALAIALLFPKMLRTVSNQAFPRPWKTILIGLVASVLAPILILLLAITFVGLPLALLVGLIWLVGWLLSGPLFAFYIGRVLLKDRKNSLITMIVGASILMVIYFVPIIGFIALLIAGWSGIGMLVLEGFSRTPKPRYQADTAEQEPRANKKRPTKT